MNSRAKIGTLVKTDPALLVPYGGEQRAIGELQALGVTLTPEDYGAIRQSLGGGKRGRARARELVPLECPTCESRLTHYERNGREPYFAATVEGSSHGPHCDVVDVASAEAPAQVAGVAERVDRGLGTDEVMGEVTALFDYNLALIGEGLVPFDEDETTARIDVKPVLEELARVDGAPAAAEPRQALQPGGAGVEETSYFFIAGAPEPSAGAQRLQRLGLGSTPPSAAAQDSAPRGTELTDARQLLIQALNRALPSSSVVRYRGHDHAVVAAADLHRRAEGERVAVYGRLTESEWNREAGRLTLKATQRSVQVWATAAAPRQLLQVESTDGLELPVLSKPMPFLAFGTLRRLGPTCGIPVIRGDSLVLLEPLTAGLRELSAESIAAEDGLTTLVAEAEPRDSDPCEPRDSELYELYDSEPDQLLHDTSSWQLDSVARTAPAGVDAPLARGADVRAGADVARASTEQPSSLSEARADGLELSPAGTSLAAPDQVEPRGRGAFSTLRSLASSLRRPKSRGGPA